jgi:hypothetical protein
MNANVLDKLETIKGLCWEIQASIDLHEAIGLANDIELLANEIIDKGKKSPEISVGDILYVRDDANKGKLSPMTVRHIRTDEAGYMRFSENPNVAGFYQNDLISKTEAIKLAKKFYQERLHQVEAMEKEARKELLKKDKEEKEDEKDTRKGKA